MFSFNYAEDSAKTCPLQLQRVVIRWMARLISGMLYKLICVVLCVLSSTSSTQLPNVAVLSSRITNIPDVFRKQEVATLSNEIVRRISNEIEKFRDNKDFQGIIKSAGQNIRQISRTVGKVRVSISFLNETEGSAPPTERTLTAADDDEFWSRFHVDNDHALQEVLRLEQNTEGWQQVAQKDGVVVEKRFLSAGTYVSDGDAAKGSKHACVKSSSVLDAHPESVFQLFADNARVRQYNEHSATSVDVRTLPEIATIDEPSHNSELSGGASATTSWLSGLARRWSKISYAVTPTYSPFKSRDFLSVVHYNKFCNGTSVIVNRPAYLASHPPTELHVRATVLLAGNIIRPYGESGNRTHLTVIAQVNPGGGADTPAAAWLINKLCAVGPPQFMRRLETAAQMGTQSAPTLVAAVSDEPTFSVQRESTQVLLDTSKRLLQTARGVASDVRRSEMYAQAKEALQKTRSAAQVLGKSLADKWEENRPALEARHGKLLLCAARRVNTLSARVAAVASALADRLEGEMNSRYPLQSSTPTRSQTVGGAAAEETERTLRSDGLDGAVVRKDSAVNLPEEWDENTAAARVVVNSAEKVSSPIADSANEDLDGTGPA